MTSAQRDPTVAARTLAVSRWGTSKTDRLARELAARQDLRPEHLAAAPRRAPR